MLTAVAVYFLRPLLVLCEVLFIYDFYKFGQKNGRIWSLGTYAVFILISISFLAVAAFLVVRPQSFPASAQLNGVALSIPTMGCEWNSIPIHIPPTTTIHVIRLSPGILRGNPQIPDIGVFEDITSKTTESMDWPAKSEGRWMTHSEVLKAISEKKGIPTPFGFKCSMTNVGTATFEDTVTNLLVDTSDGKRHIYQVSFDPLPPGQPFTFYLVNVCSSGIIPTLVQWGDSASVRVLGERGKRQVPIRFERRNWPPTLVTVFGPSSFLWNGMQDCQNW